MNVLLCGGLRTPGRFLRLVMTLALTITLWPGLAAAAPHVPKASAAVQEGKPLAPPKDPNLTGPLHVSLGIYLIQVSNLNQIRQSFDIEGYLVARWTDHRLAFDATKFGAPAKIYHGALAREKLGKEIWWPSIEFVNAVDGGSLDRYWLVVNSKGKVTYTARFKATVTSAMDLRKFPFDTQVLRIPIESYFYPASDVAFVVDPDGTGFDASHPLPEWTVTGVTTSTGVHDYGRPGDFLGRYSRFTFRIQIRRQWGYYLWKVFLPLLVILMCSWTVFWIRDLGTNISICFTILLTVVAFNLAIADTLPKVSYLTFMDTVMVVSYLGVFLSLVVVVAVHMLERSGREDMAIRMQSVARGVFPAGFALVMALLSAVQL